MADFIDLSEIGSHRDLATRALAGEVIVIRGGMQEAGVFDDIIRATLAGVASAVGPEVAAKVEAAGLHRIHEFVAPESIPGITDAAYRQLTPTAAELMDRFATALFADQSGWYFEKEPNVRFHIPYDIAAGFRSTFDKFAEKRGHGKIGAHGPHRDHWLDCPDNALNIWAALGPVSTGNGLTVFPEHYLEDIPFNAKGEVPRGVRLKKPFTFDLAPGDVVLFHSAHLHGSEVNRTDDTRAAISFRVTFGKPHFPHGHYHDYLAEAWQDGMLKPVSHWPARFQPSYVTSLADRAIKRLTSTKPAPRPAPKTDPGQNPIPLASIPIGELRAVSPKVCVARFGEQDVVAVSRFCPHGGADLADGHLDGSNIVCPWHNLRFDRTSGASDCQALPALRLRQATIADGMIHVDLASGEPDQ